MPNAFSVYVSFYVASPGLSQGSNPGLKLANAFGVYTQLSFDLDLKQSWPQLTRYEELVVFLVVSNAIQHGFLVL